MEIRQEILNKHLEEAAIEQLADDYARQGFVIQRDATVGGARADLVVRKGDDVLVFEVKAGEWTNEKRQAARRMRDAAVQEHGARFVLVLTPRPREKSIEIDGIEEILHKVISEHCPSDLSELATHARVDEITDVDLTSMNVGPEGIEIQGSASVGIALQYGSDSDQESEMGFTSHEEVPLTFHLVLSNDLRLEKVLEAKLDVEELFK